MAQIIKTRFLHQPSKMKYQMTSSTHKYGLSGQIGQTGIIDKLLKGKQNGFFIESGADDGETFSNSLFFELKRNWTGLLIEPNQKRFEICLRRNRRAYSINACLAIKPYAEEVDFLNAGQVGGIAEIPASEQLRNLRRGTDKKLVYPGTAQCFPLYDILEAVGNLVVDFFSLDVEGAEQGVLETIAWDKVDIKLILVEIEHSDKNAIVTFMKSKDYVVVQNIKAQDILFAKRGYLESLP